MVIIYEQKKRTVLDKFLSEIIVNVMINFVILIVNSMMFSI